MSRSPIRTARTPAPSACAAARNLAAMPPVATPPSILVSISAAARVGCVTPAIATPGTSETKSSSCAPNAAAIAGAAWSALTWSGRTGAASEGAPGASRGVSPASRRLWSSDARTLTISPTSPRAVPVWSGCALSRPPSTPDNPIASRPAARNAVTSSRFIGPPRTISTSSAISGVVTRRPSRRSTGRPSRRDHVVTAWPPPCTTTTGPILLKARAHSVTHAGRSSSLPPIFTTRTFSMLDTLKRAPKESLPLRAVRYRAQALACVLARESRRFWEPEHHVHVLDRLSRRALHEVVDRGDDGEARPAPVGDFSERQLALGIAPGTGDTGGRVDDDLARRIDQPKLRQRNQGQQGGRRIASGIRDELGIGEPRPREFGQPIDRVGRKAEVRREIDGPLAAGARFVDVPGGHAVRQRRQNDLGLLPGRVVSLDELVPVDPLAGRRLGGRKRHRGIRVAMQQPQELLTDIAGRPQHADRDRCMIIR